MALTDVGPGTVLDRRYRIESVLAEGGMGAVHSALDVQTGRRVALKTVLRDLSHNRELKERFEREARALFALKHPNVVEVLDFGIVEGGAYIVTELLPGKTLEALVDEAPIDPSRAIELARQMLVALAFAHAQGVIHRDLKSSNAMVVRDAEGEHVKLLDFGLVRFIDSAQWGSSVSLTTDGEILGSPAYISPEQSLGHRGDARSDVYSAGIVLFELLTGELPFLENGRSAMLRAHLSQPIPKLVDRRKTLVPRPELETLVRRALAKPPGDRFEDAVSMLSALEELPRPAAVVR
jgi:serine/threonine protein kinase